MTLGGRSRSNSESFNQMHQPSLSVISEGAEGSVLSISYVASPTFKQTPSNPNNASNPSSTTSSGSSSMSSIDEDELNEFQLKKLKKHYNKKTTWEQLSFWEKLNLIKVWHVISLVGDIFLLLGIMSFYITSSFELAAAE